MCYNVKTNLYSLLKRARMQRDEEEITELKELIKQYSFFNASGFQHPELLIYTNEEPYNPQKALWGLIPKWSKDKTVWNNTINARSESIFEKPSFKDSAKHHRCLLTIEGFYEHHHFKGKTFPYYIYKKDKELITVAGLYSDWTDRETGEVLKTFTIVTAKANKLMTQIHNNPKLPEPRMPLILSEDLEDEWLNRASEEELVELMHQSIGEILEAHTVRKLSGKESVGNVPEASEKFDYAELTQGSLF
jgi:putative SOS response-associated peptidase YedK